MYCKRRSYHVYKNFNKALSFHLHVLPTRGVVGFVGKLLLTTNGVVGVASGTLLLPNDVVGISGRTLSTDVEGPSLPN